MTTVNPVQTTTYYLTPANNPITFGTATDINVSSGSGIGVYGSNAHSWGVTNAGAISGHLYGVDLAAGGSVSNKAGGTISGGYAGLHSYQNNGYTYFSFYAYGGGVKTAGGAGTVTNAGKISGAAFGIDLAAGGSVTNKAGASISSLGPVTGPYGGSYYVGVGILSSGSAGTVTNAGNISGFYTGVDLEAGGSVTNQAGGTITDGVVVSASGSVTNQAGGTISGFNAGVKLTAGGSVVNEAGGAISGFRGVRTEGSAATVTNGGAISGSHNYSESGVGLYAGGTVINKAGGTISAMYGVYINGGAGTVTNAGDITGEGKSNSQTSEHGTGVALYAGGSVTNLSAGTISGYSRAVFLNRGADTVTNAGTISGHNIGILAGHNAATVFNTGDISGEGGIIAAGNAATVTNSGTIEGTEVGSTFFFGTIPLGDGVFMNAGGTVANNLGGTITGAGDGAYIAGGGAVTNAGTISGTIASVEFAGEGANTLTLESGSTLIGDAIGSAASGATNALVLEGTGTANNDFLNFDTLTVQAGPSWTLGGDSTFDATTVSSGTLVVAGNLSGGATTLGDPAGDLAKLLIAATGAWDILDDSGIGLGGNPSSSISNSGLFEKTGGSGTSAVAPQLLNKGSIRVSSGALDLEGAVSGNGADTISGASTLEFGSTVGGGQTVDFSGGALDLLDPQGFSGKIAGFESPDTVQLAGDWNFSSFSETGNGMMGNLTLSSGGTTNTFHFLGDYTASDFSIASGAATTIIGHT